MGHLCNIVNALATSTPWKTSRRPNTSTTKTLILTGATRSLRLVVLEVAKAEAANPQTAAASQVLARDRAAAAFAAEDLPTDSAVVSTPQGGEFAGAVVALDRDVIRHPVLPSLLCLPT